MTAAKVESIRKMADSPARLANRSELDQNDKNAGSKIASNKKRSDKGHLCRCALKAKKRRGGKKRSSIANRRRPKAVGGKREIPSAVTLLGKKGAISLRGPPNIGGKVPLGKRGTKGKSRLEGGEKD